MLVCRLLVITVLVGCGGGGHAGADANGGSDSSGSDGMHDGDTTCGDPGASFTVHAQPIASTGSVVPRRTS